MRWRAAARLSAIMAVVPLLMAAGAPTSHTRSSSAMWKINTHLFAANVALADAVDGKVIIPPFGEFALRQDVVDALNAAPSAYRAGVLAPDLFPDMYVGGWLIHSDLSEEANGWLADNWLRHVWTRARAWPNDSDRNRVLAFGLGFLTHGAGDIFAHTWVNQKADGAWVSFEGKDRSTAIKHIVLEGFVGEHTPPTNLNLDVWPRFVSNTLIKDSVARRHSPVAKHYKRWLDIADGLPKAIARAKSHMNDNINDDAPYWAKCATNPVWCARKEYSETWLLDINRGFRALVDSSESLGEMLMDGSSLDGVGAMTGWATEWVPKMFGAHALGEGASALSQFTQWAADLVPIDEVIKAEVERFMRDEFPRIWEIYQAAQKPSTYMESSGLFPKGTKDQLRTEMGVRQSTFDWRAFEPIYNTIILSKLVLLDGAQLNELARRAQVNVSFPTDPYNNIMLGIFRSLTQSYQWVGDSVFADTGSTITKFGICGPETGDPLKRRAVCGIRPPFIKGPVPNVTRAPTGGFLLWQHPEAREKIFGRIFKGFGPGPGTADRQIIAFAPPSISGVRDTRRGIRAATAEIEYMREFVAVMQDKVAGVVSTTPKPIQPGASTTRGTQTRAATAAANVATVVDWGARCCSKDVAILRASLRSLQTVGMRLQNAPALGQLGRRASATQVAQQAAQVNAALTGFLNTRDAASASTALNLVARQIESLSATMAGTR